VVEGYTDVIRCHEHGFANAVATLGTALGGDHVRLLRRLGAKKVIVVYDADAAGIRAAERALEILLEEDMAGAIVTLDGGLDPCEFLEQRPAAAFAEAVAGARDLFEFKIARTVDGRDLSEVGVRAEVVHQLMEVVARSPDRVTRALLRQVVAERLGVPEGELELRHVPGRARGEEPPPQAAREPLGLVAKAERDVAWLLVKNPGRVGVVTDECDASGFRDPVAREVVETIAMLEREGRVLDDRAILDHLSREAVEFAVNALEAEEISRPELMDGRICAAAQALSLLEIPQRVAEIDRRLKDAESAGDEQTFVTLQKERSELERRRQRLRVGGRLRGRSGGAAEAVEEGSEHNAQQ
jgi:DNA primase